MWVRIHLDASRSRTVIDSQLGHSELSGVGHAVYVRGRVENFEVLERSRQMFLSFMRRSSSDVDGLR